MVETFLLHLQLFIRISDLLPDRHHQITWRHLAVIEVVGHHILHTAKLTLLAHVEMSHDDQLHVAVTHQVHEGILLVLWQVGSRRGGVIIRGAEQPVVTDDEAVAIVVTMRELLLQPFQLPLAMGTVTRIQEDEQILVATDSIHGYCIGRCVEILLVKRCAVEVHIMVADDRKTRVVFDLRFWVIGHGFG